MSKQEQPDSSPTTFPSCEHWGQGGRFVYDPATGRRMPAEPPVEGIPAEAPTKDKKEKNNANT